MTLAPGLHDLPVPFYRTDPCPEPSLSQSLAKILLDQTALHLFRAHPRLGGGVPDEAHAARDTGSVAHELLFGKGDGIALVEAENFTTKASREARDAALAEGKAPVTRPMFDNAVRMVEALRAQMPTYAADGRGDERAFVSGDGDAERALIWQEPCGTWCRSLVDWIRVADDLVVVHDYKTTTASIAPEALARRRSEQGWHIQAAFIRRGLAAVFGEREVDVAFVVQEQREPWTVNVVRLDAETEAFAARRAGTAIARFRECLAAGAWPAWPPVSITLEMNPWEEMRAGERELFESFARHRLGGGDGSADGAPFTDEQLASGGWVS